MRVGRGPGRNGRQGLADRDRAGAGAPAAVRGGEGLVHVHVDDVEAHVARAHDPEDGVQVGAVVVEKPADAVDGLGDLDDVLLEQAERARVGEHDPGDVVDRAGPRKASRSTPPRALVPTVATS